MAKKETKMAADKDGNVFVSKNGKLVEVVIDGKVFLRPTKKK